MTALRSPFNPLFTEADSNALVSALTAVADRQRLWILALLNANGEQTISLLTAQLKISQPTVTHHVKKLEGVGLVHTRHAGRHTFVRLDAQAVADVASALSPRQAS